MVLLRTVCHFSSKANSNKLISALVSKIKYLNHQYERYLERKFPRFYQLYSTFLKGLQIFFSEAKEIRRIKTDMSNKNIQFHQLPYREMERLRQFRRDLIKAIPVGILSLPPFANYFVFLLMYLFPRQLLIRHFWTPKQQAEFLNTYHNMRREAYTEVIDGLTHLSHFPDDPQLHQRMLYLCEKVQEGLHPDITELKAKVLSRVLFLTPRLPSFFLRNRLRSHLSELHYLDQAMVKLGVSQLTDEEAQVACYTRGLNSVHLDPEDCKLWLNQWLSLSCSLRDSETSLLAHAMVLLSINFTPSSKS
ncbi:LETM1 domain-containing protein 1, partial [Ophiophagus hannah]